MKPKYPDAFNKNLPVLVGLVVGIIAGMLWIIPNAIIIQAAGIESLFVAHKWFQNIALIGIGGFWFGALQGFVWENIFVNNKVKNKEIGS